MVAFWSLLMAASAPGQSPSRATTPSGRAPQFCTFRSGGWPCTLTSSSAISQILLKPWAPLSPRWGDIYPGRHLSFTQVESPVIWLTDPASQCCLHKNTPQEPEERGSASCRALCDGSLLSNAVGALPWNPLDDPQRAP